MAKTWFSAPVKKAVCVSCHDQKASLVCFACTEAVCKTCAQFVDEDTFSFRKAIPEGLGEGAYCFQCYDSKVQPELSSYAQELERAGTIQVFTKDQTKETRLMKRSEETFAVEGCTDRDETLLRLAYQAVRAGYEVLVDVDLSSKKVRDHAYQKAMWSGTGVPARHRSQR
jgi:hypothetical protein